MSAASGLVGRQRMVAVLQHTVQSSARSTGVEGAAERKPCQLWAVPVLLPCSLEERSARTFSLFLFNKNSLCWIESPNGAKIYAEKSQSPLSPAVQLTSSYPPPKGLEHQLPPNPTPASSDVCEDTPTSFTPNTATALPPAAA